jgi:hypothetical protein
MKTSSMLKEKREALIVDPDVIPERGASGCSYTRTETETDRKQKKKNPHNVPVRVQEDWKTKEKERQQKRNEEKKVKRLETSRRTVLGNARV